MTLSISIDYHLSIAFDELIARDWYQFILLVSNVDGSW